jgi:hypothetical protein
MNTVIEVKANQKNKTFTIRKKYTDGTSVKYRTTQMNKEDFESAEMNTLNDWKHFLKYGNYFIV